MLFRSQLLGVELWRKLHIRLRKNIFASANRTVCSEFVTRIDDPPSNGIKDWEGLVPEMTSPADLLRICILNKAAYLK